ncbi:uncharacterized protein LOC128271127 isoform X1 [Anopheles cruzii]|uniref:uncharacterized protein LOC128271127 isoform X1 n=2 Tax=Anopheles cruzii TaxID=68878 RepID=UPI0022EC1FCE|nr:uncharacterized protein LOC128271127 isoform X1 [Anopheles cruzii]
MGPAFFIPANMQLPITNRSVEVNPSSELRKFFGTLENLCYPAILPSCQLISRRKKATSTAAPTAPMMGSGQPEKQIQRHVIAVVQFILSVVVGFAFGFSGIELLIGQLDFGFRLLLGIIIALIVALAEIYFLAVKLNEADDLPASVTSIMKQHQE